MYIFLYYYHKNLFYIIFWLYEYICILLLHSDDRLQGTHSNNQNEMRREIENIIWFILMVWFRTNIYIYITLINFNSTSQHMSIVDTQFRLNILIFYTSSLFKLTPEENFFLLKFMSTHNGFFSVKSSIQKQITSLKLKSRTNIHYIYTQIYIYTCLRDHKSRQIDKDS